jgi:transcription antitermination factor NusG
MNTELSSYPELNSAPIEPPLEMDWYAIQTRPRHEKAVAKSMETSGIETFSPLCPQVRMWSDRQKVVEFPLFPGYVFARMPWSIQARVRVFQTHGVIGFVGPRSTATPIPEHQIDAVRTLMRARAQCLAHPYLAVGRRVRIRNGALQGLEGILLRVADDHHLLVSVDLLHRSVAVQLKGYEVEGI